MTIIMQALCGQEPQGEVQSELQHLPTDRTLAPVIQALLAALERTPTAAVDLLTAVTPLFTQGRHAEQANALTGIGNLAKELNDNDTEIQAYTTAIAAQRQVGEEKETLVQLSIMLYNLAMVYDRQGQHAEAIPLLEEVVALDERTNHPNLESNRTKLEQVRQRATGKIASGLWEIIADWFKSWRR